MTGKQRVNVRGGYRNLRRNLRDECKAQVARVDAAYDEIEIAARALNADAADLDAAFAVYHADRGRVSENVANTTLVWLNAFAEVLDEDVAAYHTLTDNWCADARQVVAHADQILGPNW